MKRFSALLSSLVLLLTAHSFAAGATKDEKNLEREISRLSRTASEPRGEQAVAGRIAANLKVAPEKIQGLLGRGLGYGEVAAVLAIARRMTGGITDANIERVLALRQGPPVLGWGAIAKQAGVKVGTAVSQIRKISNEARRIVVKHDELHSGSTKSAPSADRATGRPAREFTGEGKSLPQGHAAD